MFELSTYVWNTLDLSIIHVKVELSINFVNPSPLAQVSLFLRPLSGSKCI